ncbi:hypothetical protein K469DRAFT_767165 [Zopfia rhizophila CBS 207.26]|uniref:Uncharacterized protein n=1 Tax=Zopfia rhizophila CBS 207.26 TaxID=1314779 RepID=A0A6A6D6S2_9PEZI|nr:hypothetical protein K469DRAFT_767165 [Zopfia rhizophila CBS 207.26]
MKSLLTVDSGVTNITAAISSGRCPSHFLHEIPNFLHHRFISSCNVINSITITIVLPYSAYASNMNNMLFPAPVGITVTTRLFPAVITLIAFSCTP